MLLRIHVQKVIDWFLRFESTYIRYTRENSKALCPLLAANYFECVSFFNILYCKFCGMPNDWMSVWRCFVQTSIEDDSNEFRCVNANKVSDACTFICFSRRKMFFFCFKPKSFIEHEFSEIQSWNFMLVNKQFFFYERGNFFIAFWWKAVLRNHKKYILVPMSISNGKII